MALSPFGHRVLLFVAVILLAVGCLYVFEPVAINWSDERLGPDAAKDLDRPRTPVPPTENLFFALLALGVPGDANLNATGRRLYADLEHDRSPPKPMEFSGDDTGLCGGAGYPQHCLEAVAASPQTFRKLVADNEQRLARYRSLQRYVLLHDAFADSAGTGTIPWSVFLQGKRLLLTSVALGLADGRVDEALARLAADLRWTRKLLTATDIRGIDKTCLTLSLHDSYRLLSDILRTRALSDPQYSALADLVAPLTPAERSLAGVLHHEFIFDAQLIRSGEEGLNTQVAAPADDVPAFWRKIRVRYEQQFIQPSATLNAVWSAFATADRISTGACEDDAALQRIRHVEAAPSRYEYNPIGRKFGQMMAKVGHDAALEVCDLVRVQRVVALQFEMHRTRLPMYEWPTFMAAAGPDLRDPYTRKPFRWDALVKGVSFPARSPESPADNWSL